MTAVSRRSIGSMCILAALGAALGACQSAPSDCGPPPSAAAGTASALVDVVNLGAGLAGGRLRQLNRDVMPLEGSGVRVTAAPGVGLIWIAGTDFADGAIEADVCGRDVYGESFVGIAFHRRSDDTYEAVYLRPFNFRATSADRRRHAIQYIAMPGHDYAHLRARFPGEFEQAVEPSLVPAGWNRLRLVVRNGRVQAFVGNAATPDLDVRSLQSDRHGELGLYVDNGSDGAFANLRILRNF